MPRTFPQENVRRFLLVCELRHTSNDYSMMMPLALIGPAHFSVSLLTNEARYSGVLRSGVAICAPRPPNRSRTEGVFIAWTAASLSFLTISAGAFLGRKSAFQV